MDGTCGGRRPRERPRRRADPLGGASRGSTAGGVRASALLALATVALLASAPAASGLLTLDAITVETGTTALTSTSLAHDTPSGEDRLLVVSATWDDANDGALSSVSYGGNPLTCLDAAQRGDAVGAQICYLLAPPTGSNTLDVSWTVSVAEWGLVARSLTDVHQTSPIGAATTANGSGTDATTQVTTTDADSTLVTAVAAEDGTISLSPVEGTDEDAEDAAGLVSTGLSLAAGRANTTSTGAYKTGWSLSANQPWALPVVEILRGPEQVAFNRSSSTGDESATSPTVEVTLDRESSEEVTVDYSWTGGNASSSDHNVSSGTIRFPAGSTSETLTLDVTDDRADEPDETLELRLENPDGAERATPHTHVYTIADDDPNHAPDPSGASVSTDEDTDVSDTVTATDPDQNDTIDSYAVDTQPSHGSLTFDASTGEFTYSPDPDYDGDDSFAFTATDEHGATSSPATVDVTVNAVNDPPSAADDAAAGDEDETMWIDVLANDSDVDDTLAVASATSPPNGSTSLPGNGTIAYTPDADWNGDDAFDYDVTDGSASDTATVNVTVDAVNDAPSAADDAASTPVDETVWIDVLANDTDPDGDTLSVASASSPDHGTTSVPGNGTVAYTPDAGYSGPHAFTYDASDGSAASPARVNVTVGSGGAGTEVLSSHVRVLDGSLDAEPTLRTLAEGSSVFLQLENATGGIELSELGASNRTTIEINLTTSNFTPTTLMGRTQVVDWTNATNDDGTENVSLELQPIAMAFIDDCEQYASFMGYCGPSSVENWPSDPAEDQADVAFDAGLRVFLSDLSYLNATMQDRLQGAYLTTDAQALGRMNVSGADGPGGASLEIPVAGPHTRPDGSQNEGFFEARLPDGLLSWWGIDDPERLTGTYEGENRSVAIANVPQGTEVRMDVHYSSGEVNITEDTTDPAAEAGPDRTVTEGETVTLDGSNSTDNQEVTAHDWDLGDGDNATGATSTHAYEDPGTYTVTLTVSDRAGNTDTDTLTVTVEAVGGGNGGPADDEADGTGGNDPAATGESGGTGGASGAGSGGQEDEAGRGPSAWDQGGGQRAHREATTASGAASPGASHPGGSPSAPGEGAPEPDRDRQARSETGDTSSVGPLSEAAVEVGIVAGLAGIAAVSGLGLRRWG